MKSIVYIVENPGADLNTFITKAEQQFENLQFVTEVEETEKTLVEGVIHVKQKLSGTFLSDFPNLRFIATAFTGYDSVDAEYCTEQGISVYNVPEYSTNSVAELTLGLAISLLREIPRGGKVLEEGEWTMAPGIELAGKTVAVIGTGAIGCRVAELFKAFGCNIHGWSRTERERFFQSGTYYPTITDAIKDADIVSLHIPSNKDTKGIIGSTEINAMKQDAFIINTARGPIIEEKALIKALTEKNIAGAALDVFDIEPLAEDHPYRKMKNVIATPHIAFKTKEALERKGEITLANINNYLSGGTTNKVL